VSSESPFGSWFLPGVAARSGGYREHEGRHRGWGPTRNSARRSCELLRWVKIIDLLIDVDEMTEMSPHLIHLQTGEPVSCGVSDATALPTVRG
jgi:hypothetical protein